MSATKWFKFYGGEYLSDPKIESLTPEERSCWVTLMCLASVSSDPGVIEFLPLDILLMKSGVRKEPSQTVTNRHADMYALFTKLKMIEVEHDGDKVTILNWLKRQDQNKTGAERAKDYRDRKLTVTKTSQPKVTKVTLDKNRIDKNRIYTNTSETSSQEIPLVIKSFEVLNPASKKFYGIPVQRKACSDLIEAYGLERVISVIEKTLPKTNGIQYFPTITTPLQLFDKWATLESKIKQYQSEKTIKNDKYQII